MRMGAALIAAALLLTGCATPTSAPKGGLTQAELAEYQAAATDRMWRFTGLDDSLRPEVEVTTVELVEWIALMDGCNQETITDDPEMQTEQAVAQYACRARHQLSPEALGLLNTAQLDYLYDYYQDRLIPCLRSRDVFVPDVPTRVQATDVGRFGGYPWNPYNGIVDFVREDPDDVATWHNCPAFPPDEVFDQHWERFDPYWRG